MEINKILLGDCMNIMQQIDNESIDLIITDPPYGDNIVYGRNNKEIKNNENPLINCHALMEFERILKNNSNVYLFTNWKHYPFLKGYIEEYTSFNIRMLIVYVKNHFGMGYGFRNQYELIVVLEKGSPDYNLNDFSNIVFAEHINQTENTHPHQKDWRIIQKIIKHSSKENDIILDPFAGSGQICLAAKQLKRNYIGIEIEEKWHNFSNNKLNQNIITDFLKGGSNEIKNI